MQKASWQQLGEQAHFKEGKNGVPYISFPALEAYPRLRHGYSTRLGGVSTGYCAEMSFSQKCGDTIDQIRENFRRMAEAIGVREDMLVLTDQVHEATVLPVSREHVCGGDRQTILHKVDGIVTNEPDLTLVCFTADCVPLFFYDPVKQAIGLSHAGWRGTVLEIGKKTVQTMREVYGTKASDLRVVIGPSICVDCYEISEEVANAFRKVYPPESTARFLFPHTKGTHFPEGTLPEQQEQHYQLDLWQANREALLAAGVPSDQISVSGVCTCCHADLFHSHRATGGKRGLLTGYLSIRKQ